MWTPQIADTCLIRAFSQLVADVQFCALGLTLLGALAKVNAILGAQQSLFQGGNAANPAMSLAAASPILGEDPGEQVVRTELQAAKPKALAEVESSNAGLDPRGLAFKGKPAGNRGRGQTRTIGRPLATRKLARTKDVTNTNIIDELFRGLT